MKISLRQLGTDWDFQLLRHHEQQPEFRPSSSGSTYPFYLGTSSYYWHYAYIGSNTVKLGSSTSSKLGFFSTTPVTRQTVSSSATVSTLITALKKYGLIG